MRITFSVYIPYLETEYLVRTDFVHGIHIKQIVTPELQMKFVFSLNNLSREYVFQRMVLKELPGMNFPEEYTGARGEFILDWDVIPGQQERNVTLRASAGLLKLAKDTNQLYPLYVTDVKLPLKRIFPDLKPSSGATQQERIFLHVVEELDERLAADRPSHLEYDLIKSASLLRQLLLDDGGVDSCVC